MAVTTVFTNFTYFCLMEKEYSVVLPMTDYIGKFRDADRFIEYCKVCGQYGTCWACPPFDFDTDKVLGRYDSILLVAVKTDVSSGPGKTADPESLPDKCGIADCADSVRTGMPVSGKSGGVDTGVDVCPDNEMRMRLLDRVRVVMDKRLLEKEAELHGMAFFAGTCMLCGDPCYPDDALSGQEVLSGSGETCWRDGCTRRRGLPCRHPGKVRPSLEAFGFDLVNTARELFGIELQWGGGKAGGDGYVTGGHDSNIVSVPEYYVLVGAVAY